MKNILSGILFCLIAVLVALPANAAFVGHTIEGSAIQGGSNLFFPDTATIMNSDFSDVDNPIINIEFESSGIVGLFNADPLEEIDITVVADFYQDDIFGPVLDVRVFRTDGSGGFYTISGLTLTFSDMNYIDGTDEFLLNSVDPIPSDLSPGDPGYHAPLQGLGLGHTANAPLFTLSFSDFEVDESREDRFQLSYVTNGALPPDPVVPVPAPLALSLIGLGSVALRRVFA